MARLIQACESFVVAFSVLGDLTRHLEKRGFKADIHQDSVNAFGAGSALRIQLTTDPRYQEFLSRSMEAEVLGLRVKIACLEDGTQGCWPPAV